METILDYGGGPQVPWRGRPEVPVEEMQLPGGWGWGCSEERRVTSQECLWSLKAAKAIERILPRASRGDAALQTPRREGF